MTHDRTKANHAPITRDKKEKKNSVADEIDAAVARVQEMHADGSLSSWFKQKEQLREEIGQTTNLYLTKSE